MSNTIEKKLAECHRTIEQIKDLAIRLGIDPSDRWFRDQTGIVPRDVKRAGSLPDVKPVDAYRELDQMHEKLRKLEAELEALAGKNI